MHGVVVRSIAARADIDVHKVTERSRAASVVPASQADSAQSLAAPADLFMDVGAMQLITLPAELGSDPDAPADFNVHEGAAQSIAILVVLAIREGTAQS